jgi:hypothetical protein
MERGLIAKTTTGRLASRQIPALLTLSTKFGFFAVFSGIMIICVSMRCKIHSSILKGLSSFSPGLARFLEGLPRVTAIIFRNPEGVESKTIAT